MTYKEVLKIYRHMLLMGYNVKWIRGNASPYILYADYIVFIFSSYSLEYTLVDANINDVYGLLNYDFEYTFQIKEPLCT